jgi:hypothetical protein
MSLTYKDILSSLLPDGDMLRPEEGEGLDLFLQGMGENEERMRQFLAELAHLRNPDRTILLSDLEKEYGIKTNENITESDRRAQLAGIMYARRSNGSRDFLQTQLQRAGYAVNVYDNAPAVDPNPLIFGQSQMYCGDTLAQCGEPTAQCAAFDGELVVNGDIGETIIEYTMRCGDTLAQCGEPTALAGNYSGVSLLPYDYEVPSGVGTEVERWWNMVFFVGGDVVRGGGGEITSISFVDIPIQNRKTLRQLILKYKPMHSWGALAINWI